MPGIYRPPHPERTALYRVLFHNFDRFLTAYESHFEKAYGHFRQVVREVVDRITRHLELTFEAERPPPLRIFEQVALMAGEESGEYG